MSNAYTRYYLIQSGGGVKHIGPLYSQPLFIQRGHGIGGFLVNILKYLTPLAREGWNALKDQGYKTGRNVIHDLIGRKPLDQILKDQGKQAVLDLTEKGLHKIQETMKQTGKGIKRKAKRRSRHTSAVGGRIRKLTKKKQVGGRRPKTKSRRRAKTRKTKQRTLDIFQ